MKISLTNKLIIGVVFILIISLVVLERRASGIFLGDKIRTLNSHSSQISYSLAVSTAEKVKRLDRHLRLILTHSALNTPTEARPRGEEMILVGLMNRTQGQPWNINWIIKAQNDRTIEQLSQDFLIEIQKTVELDKIRSDEHIFARLVANDGQPMFVMLTRMSKATDASEKVAAAVLSPSSFFDFVSPFKGSLTSAFIVDQSGVTYAHPSMSLTGAILKGNPIVDRITQKFSASQLDQYEDGSEQLIGSYDQVPKTNLVAVSSTSLTKSKASLNELKWSFVVLGLGLLMLAGILAVYISRLLKSPISKLRRVVDDLASGKVSYAEQSSEIEISELASSLNELEKKMRLKEIETQNLVHEKIYKEKMSAFARLSSGLVNELRNPLIGILGHTQLAREKIRDTESLRRHLDLIEKDVRKTKDLIEDISQLPGSEKLELESVNIFEAVTAAIEQAGRKILPQNISILKNLESVSSVTANAVLLRKALLNVLSSAGELIGHSEDKNSTREIIVRLENQPDHAKVTVIFESHLVGGDDLMRIFDPFMSTEGKVDLGLDLALARGILEAHDAQISLEQTGQTHFQFVILLPKVKDLPAIEVSSPFAENPGLELKGLNFALPDFSMGEQKEEGQRAEELLPPLEGPLKPSLISKQIMPKVPLENLKIKIRKPTLRV